MGNNSKVPPQILLFTTEEKPRVRGLVKCACYAQKQRCSVNSQPQPALETHSWAATHTERLRRKFLGHPRCDSAAHNTANSRAFPMRSAAWRDSLTFYVGFALFSLSRHIQNNRHCLIKINNRRIEYRASPWHGFVLSWHADGKGWGRMLILCQCHRNAP